MLVAVLVLAGVGAGVFALTGDDGDPGSPDARPSRRARRRPAPTAPVDPAATEPPTPELAPFYSQTIAWEECGATSSAAP